MQNGVLSEICGEDRHVRELRTNRFRSDSSYYKLERIGWESALTMYGYCAKCDSRIFKPLEHSGPTFPSDAETAAKYSLRPIVHEIRKKEGNLDFFSGMPRTKLPQGTGGDLERLLLETRHQIQVLRQTYDHFWRASHGKAEVCYAVRRSQRVPLCASALLLRPLLLINPTGPITPSMLAAAPMPSFNVINIFPKAEHLITVSTYISGDREAADFNRQLETTNDSEYSELLSQILISQIEDWAISEDIYSKLPSDADAQISSAKQNHQGFDAKPAFRIA